MKILIGDAFSPAGIALLRKNGHEVYDEPALKEEALEERLREARPQILVVRSTRVTAEMMAADPDLELIVRAGAGYDTIDVDAASALGIFVANCPGKNAAAVAELAFGLILALDRRIPDNVASMRAGRWNKGAFSKAEGLKGKTLGLVGFGSIAREMVPRARAFGMPVVAWSRSLTDEEAARFGVERKAGPLDVAAAADVVSLHVASTPETRRLADASFFEAMRPGAYFINTTRGAVVDEEALRRAMDEKGIRAAVDVLQNEPQGKEGPFEHPLGAHPNLYATHHIGASTNQAENAIGDEAVRVITVYAETGQVPNCVNLAARSPASHLITVRHRDRVGVLAAVLDEMRKASWNVQEMENLIFEGAQAACARIRFDGRPDEAVIRRITDHPDVLAVTLLQLSNS